MGQRTRTLTELDPNSWRDGARGVHILLTSLGYDLGGNGLRDTPHRVARAWQEMTSGERVDPREYLRTVFHPGYDVDEMIVLRQLRFASLCEHHILPFVGYATVGYIPAPGAGIVGVSKLARVVEAYAHRLQVQERMTSQIADCLQSELDTIGVGVTLRAEHTCMALRGIRSTNSEMVTSVTRGHFRDDPRTRAEFFELAKSS